MRRGRLTPETGSSALYRWRGKTSRETEGPRRSPAFRPHRRRYKRRSEPLPPARRSTLSCRCARPPTAKICRSEEHTSELQSLLRISYAVICLKKKMQQKHNHYDHSPYHRNNTHIIQTK